MINRLEWSKARTFLCIIVGLLLVISFIVGLFIYNDGLSIKDSIFYEVRSFSNSGQVLLYSPDMYGRQIKPPPPLLKYKFGEEGKQLFGHKVDVHNLLEANLESGGYVIDFTYSVPLFRTRVVLYSIRNLAVLDEKERTACFLDDETGMAFIVKKGRCFYELEDKKFFQDLLAEFYQTQL